MIINKIEVKKFQKEILDWYAKNKRDLPWREVPVGTSLEKRFYRVLVSEIMLQQTQVARVIAKYEEWLKIFPTLEVLAKAKTSDVLRLWSGLGYNRRALYLKKIANVILGLDPGIQNPDSRLRGNDKKERFPQTIEELRKLSGIGEYTARAVACFAFDEQVAVVDTNVRKVILTRLPRSLSLSRNDSEKEIQQIADELLPVGKAYDWNHALMDYASMMLAKEKVPSASWRSKQSKFIGSNRYYRGQIIKLLVVKEKISLGKLAKILDKDREFVQGIIDQLKKDGLIRYSKKIISL